MIPNAADAAFADQAQVDSVDLDIITAGGRLNGVVSGCLVGSTGTTNGSVQVPLGYIRYNDVMEDIPATTVAIAANSSGNTRYDLITVSILTSTPVVTQGSPAVVPTFPSIPASSVVLAAVRVPNGHTGSTTIPANTITDKRVMVVKPVLQVPDFWSVYGHSYWQYSGGANDQTGRADSLLRAALDIEHNNWRNHAKNGALAWYAGMGGGNWSRVFNTRGKYHNRTTGPYCGEGGAVLLGYGINDIGTLDFDATILKVWKSVNKAMISRCRAGVVYHGALAGRTVFGAGFTQVTNDYNNGAGIVGQSGVSAGGTRYEAGSTTNATITMTLPTDFAGEVVAMCFLGSFGGSGTVTFTGTLSGGSGLPAPLDLRNHTPGASFVYSPIVTRITGLSSSNAGQTIIATVTSIDGGTSVRFTDWWLESLSPPPVLVCNINRPALSGYGAYGGWTGTEAEKDQDVLDANAGQAAIVAEFDSMVQIVDLDAVIGKSPSGQYTSDGLHPNEIGAARIVDQCLKALQNIYPVTVRGNTSSMNTPSPRSGNPRQPHMSSKWYTTDAANGFGTSASVVAGEQYAMPFIVTEGREIFYNWGMEAMNAVAGTAVRIGCYDDIEWLGYPQSLIVGGEPTGGGAFTVPTATGKFGSGIGTPWRTDPGLYWLVVKFTTVGTAHTFRCLLGPTPCMSNLTSTGAGGTNPVGYKLTGMGTGALEDYYPQTGATSVDSVPYVGIQLL